VTGRPNRRMRDGLGERFHLLMAEELHLRSGGAGDTNTIAWVGKDGFCSDGRGEH
jgi:hypothetical protein